MVTTIITSASHFIARFVFRPESILVEFKNSDSKEYIADVDLIDAVHGELESGMSPGKVYNQYLRGNAKVAC